jgi:hypothetical protein
MQQLVLLGCSRCSTYRCAREQSASYKKR